ncbi:MAG TPA: ATP-binding cassette domain-containing protein [Blastocatellia bacterium]|nr:ATP-binding cassette domain-containing protein [Blastocatellia bacterium]
MSIILDQITKCYGGQPVVDHVSLEVADGELFVLLGGSGSGKSTILRMIAGLAEPSGGRILLRGRDVTNLEPQRRGVGFVFQNYTIFRHMSIAENIEFGLRIRKVAAAERARRREQLLELVGLAGLGGRFANQLSGGQQQRVALARALAYEPDVLLLDEPFGALDVKIRAQLRRSLREIQRQLGVTTILVTHDQEEAFELADRIGVLERGRLLEVGPPETLYARPQSLAVATFVGAGTVLTGRALDGRAHFGPLALPIPDDAPHEDGAAVRALFRPEQVALSEERPNGDALVVGLGTVIDRTFTGAANRVRLRLPRLAATRQVAPPPPFGEEGLLVDAVIPAEKNLTGDALWVSLRGWHILKPPTPRLLVIDHHSGSTASLAVAREMAERLRASVTLLGVAADSEHAESLHEDLKRRKEEAGLSWADVRVRQGDPAEQIAMEQTARHYEMVVLSPKPKKFQLKDAGANPDAAALDVLRRAEIPVLVVNGERLRLSKILICTAAGEPGKSDVRFGGRLARRLGAEATLFHVDRKGSGPGAFALSHLERASATLRALDVKSQTLIRAASTPAVGILQEAREGDYDLIVMGSHGPDTRKFFRPDDVTMQVVAAADRPVLIVPSEEFVYHR